MKKIINTLWISRLSERLGRLLDTVVRWLPMAALVSVAYWCGWQGMTWLAPSAHQYRPVSSPIPLALGARIVDAHWFGIAPVESVEEALTVKVLGVYAPTREASGGFAIVQDGARSIPLLPGQTVMGRWKLERITASGVVVRAGTREEFVPLVSYNSHPAPVPSQNTTHPSQLLSIPDEASPETMIQK